MSDPTNEQAKKHLKKFRDNPKDGHFRFALFKETKAYRDFFNANREKLLRLCDSMTDEETRLGVVESFLYKIRELFDINAEFFLNEKPLSADRIIAILDPSTDIEYLADLGLSDFVWPWLMHTPGIVPVQMDPDDKTIWSEEPRRERRELTDLKRSEPLKLDRFFDPDRMGRTRYISI